jgi:hypothetical protein
MSDYLRKVQLIAKAKYDLEEEVLEAYIDTVEQCERNNFTPRRTVEFLAELIFSDLKSSF